MTVDGLVRIKVGRKSRFYGTERKKSRFWSQMILGINSDSLAEWPWAYIFIFLHVFVIVVVLFCFVLF